MVEAIHRMEKRSWRERLAPWVTYLSVVIMLALLFPMVPAYAKTMMTQILIFGIFSMSLNLLIGYTGLFSLGHAALFGAGGYTSAILIIHFGVTNFWLAAIAGILAATVTAAIFGVIVLRVTGIYFLFITLALGELLGGVALKWDSLTGGTSGLIGIGYPDLGVPVPINEVSFFYLVLIILIICSFLLYRFVHSPFGCALQGIREDERLMQHLGYNTWLFKYITFIIAGAFAGVAGVLFGYFINILVPTYLTVTMSTTVALMVIIGSSSTIFGPILGAAIILFLQYYASVFSPERWPLILGSAFVITVIFLPGGVGIYLPRLWNKMKYR
jgi:branched-chain amino acid transport system permease protein